LYWLRQRRSRESEKLLYSVYMETSDRELKKLLEPHIDGSKIGDISSSEGAIPVRVFYKGSQVDDLSMSDFKLYESKQERKVAGFRIIKKRMKRQGDVPSRYFVLGFRLTNYNKQIREGVSHLFENILRKEDQLLIFINDKRLNFDNLADLAAVQAEVNRVLRRESSLTRGNMDKYLKEMERRLNPDRLALNWEMNNLAVVNLMKFLDVYRKAWQDYKEKYLLPDIDSYYRLAGHLEKIRKEKWVIHFYQVDMFPELAAIGVLKERAWEIVREISSYSGTRSYSRTLSRQLLDIDKLRNITDDFPVETISRLFYKADATFFTLFMHTAGAVLSKDFEYTRIASALEKSLRQVSLNTGGALIASNDLRSALDEVSGKESTSYMLNYTPGNLRKPGKIRVKISDNRYKVFYDENMSTDYINDYLEKREAKTPSVRVEDILFKEKKLTVVISDFLIKSGPEEKSGRIDVRVRIKDKQGRVLFDQTRNITANRGTFRITLNFDWLQKGTYNIAVEVTDLFTGKIGTKTINRKIR